MNSDVDRLIFVKIINVGLFERVTFHPCWGGGGGPSDAEYFLLLIRENNQCWFNVAPPFTTLAQHHAIIVSASHI